MQHLNIVSLAAFLSTAAALPTPDIITFNGAAGAQYSLAVSLDNVAIPTNNDLSISSITSNTINVENQCTLDTVDFPPTLVEGPSDTWVIGPPQIVTSISCGTDDTPPLESIDIEFQGADPTLGAQYTVNVPLNGEPISTNNELSISTLVSSFAAIASQCDFEFVNGSADLVALSDDTWAVGPPQTIESVSCTA